jgi:hypothetical protein
MNANENNLITRCEQELREAVRAIQQPRTNFQLQHFVVGQHDSEPRRWMQCVLELQVKLHHLRRAEIEQRITRRRIASLRTAGTTEATDEADLLEIDRDAHSLGILGAIRETEALFAIYKSFPRGYTNAELNAAEEEYWQLRLARQAKHSLVATGRIGLGDLDSLYQLGNPVDLALVRKLEAELCQNVTHPTETCSAGPSNRTAGILERSPSSNTPGDSRSANAVPCIEPGAASCAAAR